MNGPYMPLGQRVRVIGGVLWVGVPVDVEADGPPGEPLEEPGEPAAGHPVDPAIVGLEHRHPSPDVGLLVPLGELDVHLLAAVPDAVDAEAVPGAVDLVLGRAGERRR